MTVRDTKIQMIEALLNRGEWIQEVNSSEFRTRCPFCGDSQKNYNTGHLYIHINPGFRLSYASSKYTVIESNLPVISHDEIIANNMPKSQLLSWLNK